MLNDADQSIQGAPLPASAFGAAQRRISDGLFVAAVTLIYAAVVGVGLSRHEIWHDETQAWLIARDSESIPSLFSKLGYEGHPAVWYLILFGLTRVTHDPVAMQAAHFVIAVATAFVIVRFAPFPRLWRALLCFGYFIAFEYAVISRGYGLGILLLFLACATLARSRRTYLDVALILALMCNVSLFSMLLAFAFAVAMVVDWSTGGAVSRRSVTRRNAVASALLLGLGATAALATMWPPPDALIRGGDGAVQVEYENFGRSKRVVDSLTGVWEGFVPLPRRGTAWWNSNLLVHGGGSYGPAFGVALSGLLFIAVSLVLRRQLPAATLFVVGTLAVVLFYLTVKRPDEVRHHGNFFILFIAGCWLSRLRPDPERAGVRRGEGAFVLVLLGLQVAAAAYALASDFARPFSRAAEVARLIRRVGPPDAVIVAGTHRLSPVSAVLDRPLYAAARNQFVTYFPLVRGPNWRATKEQMLSACAVLLAEGRRVVLVSRVAVATDDLRLTELADLGDSIAPDENYHVYAVERHAPATRLSSADETAQAR